jgi:7-carboxy-7-deazaguanine synthase
MKANTMSLRLTEIFFSLQGEARTVGRPTVFIRLTGCPLRCVWCDTEYAFNGGKVWSIDEILQEIKPYSAKYITVTGGEPLAQPECLTLLRTLADEGYSVSLETSGALDVAQVDARISKVMDLKAPGSGEVQRNLNSNIAFLNPQDQVKIVICDRQDYDWAKFQCDRFNLYDIVDDVLFSPAHGQLDPTTLAEWILADRLNVRMQLQLHKYLWNNQPGH